jgi:ATPase subunit of ABC transporter with duplicated ATPase domains
MTSVRIEGLSFAYRDNVSVLEQCDARFTEGWTGLVGENGCGKTTLLELVAGRLEPNAGCIRLEPPGARAVLCPQRIEVEGEDVASLAERDDGEALRIRGELRLVGAALARWSTLSPGERKRWQVGAALACEPEVLLLDEPTNHIDAQTRALLLGALRRFRGVGLLVSHDRALLAALTDRTLRLHRGQARQLACSYERARSLWEAEARAAWERRAEVQAEERRAARKLADARRARDAAESALSGRRRDPKDRDARSVVSKTRRAWAEDRLGGQVKRLRAAADRASEAVPDAPDAALGRSVFLGYARAPRPVLLAIDRPEIRAGGQVLLREVKLKLGRDDRVRLEGANGSGKTTLLAALCAGSTIPPERLLLLPQELDPDAGTALLEEVRGLERAVRGRVLSLLAALGTDPDRLLGSANPSPGEARKLQLALGLGRHAWALVLDEPTNHLDLPTIERLEEALTSFPGAILLVTHDTTFSQRCTTTTWALMDGRVVG